MTVQITSRDQLEDTFVRGTFIEITNQFNMAASKGLQFISMDEVNGPYGDGPVAVEVKNVTRLREVPDDALSPL